MRAPLVCLSPWPQPSLDHRPRWPLPDVVGTDGQLKGDDPQAIPRPVVHCVRTHFFLSAKRIAVPVTETRSVSNARRPAWGIRPRLIVDILLAIGFLVLMSPVLTGLPIHEWLGLGVLAIVLVHLLAQWDWTHASTRRFVSQLSSRLRLTYVLNWVLFVSLCVVMLSGVMISEVALPALGVGSLRTPGPAAGAWRLAHTLSANALIGLAGIHLGLNWRWVVSALPGVTGWRSRPSTVSRAPEVMR